MITILKKIRECHEEMLSFSDTRNNHYRKYDDTLYRGRASLKPSVNIRYVNGSFVARTSATSPVFVISKYAFLKIYLFYINENYENVKIGIC